MLFFFFNDTATTEIYTLSLHDALPIFVRNLRRDFPNLTIHSFSPTEIAYMTEITGKDLKWVIEQLIEAGISSDRKSTRLNSSHANISYAVFCLKKKKNKRTNSTIVIS